MRVGICDICYYETNTPIIEDRKYSPAKYKLSFKNGASEKLSLDACEKHKDYLKTCNSYKQAQEKVYELHGLTAK